MIKILLIEDEISLVEFTRKGLTEGGYEVSVALNGESALKMAPLTNFDLYILDIMLPDKNGIEVCKELKKITPNTPVLFLTALGSSENIAFGLNIGADDYLVKPFKFIELYARINALLRRSSPKDVAKAENIYVVSDLIVDDNAKTIMRGDTIINLTATEYRLLLTLLHNKGKVMSRVQLLESAWDINFNMGTNVVDVYINYLRKKIDSDRNIKLIHTVVGMGYVLKEK